MPIFGEPRLVRFGKVAFRAELRRRQVRGYVLRAAFGDAVAVFAFLALLGCAGRPGQR